MESCFVFHSYSGLYVRKNKILCALVLLNWQTMNFFVVDILSLYMWRFMCQVLLWGSNPLNLLSMLSDRNRGVVSLRLVSAGRGVSKKCENFYAFAWRSVSKSSKKWFCRERRGERLNHEGGDEWSMAGWLATELK